MIYCNLWVLKDERMYRGMYVICYYLNFSAVKITRSLGNFFGFFERNLLLTLRFLELCACAFSVISVISSNNPRFVKAYCEYYDFARKWQ